MSKIKVLSTQEAAEKVTSQLLASCPEVGIACKFGRLGEVSLVALCSGENNVFVFDVKNKPDVMFHGGVARILQSNDVQKVMHDCSSACANLEHHQGILLRNIFDSQVAYSVLLETKGLPPRWIDLAKLCDKTYIALAQPSHAFKTLLAEDENVWMRRPLTSDMVNVLASEIASLFPVLYSKLRRALRPEHMSWLEKMTREHQLSQLRVASVKRNRKDRIQQQRQDTAKARPLITFTDTQRALLAGATPLSRGLF